MNKEWTRTLYWASLVALMPLGGLVGCAPDPENEATETATDGGGSTSASDGSTSADDDSTDGGVDTTGSSGGGDVDDTTTGGEVGPQAGVRAVHLTMRDGTRIAVDVWLPAAVEDGITVPTIVQSTRYWRAIDLLPGAPPGIDQNLEFASAATSLGYAMLLVDARGSGASFGQREIPWSDEEQQDFGEVVRWTTEQSWSDQRVIAWGISYDGNAADLLPAQDLDSLVAVAPLFTDYDPYLAIARPGGLMHEGFLQAWSATNVGLDANEICALVPPRLCDAIEQVATGVKPVDEDGPALLEAAVAEHEDNVDVFEAIASAPYRDSPFGASGRSLDDVAPFSHQDAIEAAGVPVFAVGSWLDGSTARSALQRFETVQVPQQVIIGPWNHAASSSGDPFVPFEEPEVPPVNELAFELFGFIGPLAEGAPADSVSRSVRYYVLNDGGWRTSEDWPPAGVEHQQWALGSDGTLVADAPISDGIDTYAVDFTATTGQTNRWFTQLAGAPVIYEDRAAEDDKLLTYTSPPFEADVELVGAGVVDLYVDVSVPDAAFYAYLEIVDGEGVVTYVTEGQIAGVHRQIAEGSGPYVGQAVHHSYQEADAAPLLPGTVEHVRFELQPTAVHVHPGERVRLALAGHDAGNFERVPARGPVTWQVHRSAAWPSRVTLPVVAR